MNPKAKKVLLWCGLGLDVALTVFLFVLSIIMLATQPESNVKQHYEANPGMITYFQAYPNVFLLACVLPLGILLVGNIVLLVLYVNKAGKAKTQLSDLSEEQKAALRAEILKDMDKPEDK